MALGSHGLTGKQNVYQHGVKLPLILSGPGIPKGETRDQLCYIYDIYPTLCGMAGLEVPETVQYESLTPIVSNAGAQGRGSLYFSFMSWHRAVTDGRHKLIEFCVEGKRHTQLFDLKQDPEEVTNLAEDPNMSEKLKSMRKLLEAEAQRYEHDSEKPEHIRKMSDSFWTTYRAN